MNFSSFKYLIKQGFKSMFANRMMSVASIGVLTACLFITGAATLLSFNVNNYATYLVGRSEIVVYLWDTEEQKLLYENPDAAPTTVTPIDADVVRTEIEKIENVKDYEFITKEQALAEVGEMLDEYNNLITDYQSGLRDNPLPASFRITVKNLLQIEETANKLNNIQGVQKIVSPNDLAIILISIKNAVNYAGIALIGILGIVSLVIVANTIRLTVFARRKEINIMKFVGATNTFIRMPFFVEGMAVGFISAVIAFALLSGSYIGFSHLLVTNLESSTSTWLTSIVTCLIPYKTLALPLFGVFAGSGILLGGIGSGMSIRKHLKV